MKVYTCTEFKGFYPVGTAAVIVAASRLQALRILQYDLKVKHGLTGKRGDGSDLTIDDLIHLPISIMASVQILNDGNY